MAIIMTIVPMAYTVRTTDRTLVCGGLGGGAVLTFGCTVLVRLPYVRAAIGVG